jgi:tetratricopeptide (TPR) repeat protein
MLYQDLGYRNGQAGALVTLGQVRLSTGDYAGGVHDLGKALELFRRIGARGNQAWALNQYAAAIAATGDHTQAAALYRDALHLAHETDQPDEQALALEGIGHCHLHADATQPGIGHLEQALGIFQRLGMRPEADRVQARLSRLTPMPGR